MEFGESDFKSFNHFHVLQREQDNPELKAAFIVILWGRMSVILVERTVDNDFGLNVTAITIELTLSYRGR